MVDNYDTIQSAEAVLICDTTLRDAEGAAGVVLSNVEKYRLAKLLDDAGIPQMEVGMPIKSVEETIVVKHIAEMGLQTTVSAACRASTDDIDAAIDCGVDYVSVSLPASDVQIANVYGEDREWVRDRVYEAISYAKAHGLYVSCVIEDAPRSELGFLIGYAMDAVSAKTDRIAYADSVGVEDPFSLYERVKMLKKVVNMDIEIQARNDYGMATANTLAGVKAGANFVGASVLGIGSRAGNAPLEEVALMIEQICGKSCGIDFVALRKAAEAVAKATGRKIWETKPVFGSGVFAQEIGLGNMAGILDPYNPEIVGGEREVVIGKHISASGIAYVLAELGREIEEEQIEPLRKMVTRYVGEVHRNLTPEELEMLFDDMIAGVDIFDDSLFFGEEEEGEEAVEVESEEEILEEGDNAEQE